jgi:F0F1-type ATP synthase assembly protein I
MNLVPKKLTNVQSPSRGSDLGRGAEFAMMVALFVGLGYLLDRIFGTKPVFMIVLFVLSIVGQFASMWYGYDQRMRELEEERRERANGARR